MAELLASAIVETLVGKLISASLREIGRLWGLADELDGLRSTFTALQSAVEDAEMQQRKSKSLQDWLRKLKDAAYDVENALDMMQYERLRQMADSERGKLFPSLRSSFRLRFRCKMAKQVKDVRKKLVAIADERRSFPLREGPVENRYGVTWESRQTGWVVNEVEILGRDEEKELMMHKFLDDAQNQDSLSVFAICGMGGLGKTTLAQLLYNDGRTEKHFDLRIWVCVSDDFDVQRLLMRILECIDGANCNISELDPLQRHLREKLMGKRYLLVLDDVWNENGRLWDVLRETIRCDSSGSVLMVTTRIQSVATLIGASYVHDIGCLSQEDSWSLFKQRAFLTREVDENLVWIGKAMVEKCGGVPLAIKALGSMMRLKSSEREWSAIKESEIWDLLDDENGIMPALRLSYYNLDPHVRQCFAYCCVFPKDYVMEEDQLIQLWMANGFVPSDSKKDPYSTCQSIFKELTWRSFFQDIHIGINSNTTCKMHDLMHDLAVSVMRDETYTAESLPTNELKIPLTTRHLFFNRNSGFLPNEYGKFKLSKDDSLWSLIIDIPPWLAGEILKKKISSFLSKQQFLRVIDSPACYIESLSNLFCKLKHLKHLAISCHGATRLPNSLTCLYNLQTLKLAQSRDLLELPEDLRVMKNLWILEIEETDSLLRTPPGLGELRCLQRLSIFIVNKETSGKIDQLGELNLGGELHIKGLDNVRNLEDAKSAGLMDKRDLISLSLSWMKDHENDRPECFEEVLGGLQPHHSLERIFIESYRGSKFPEWMSSSIFINLKEISLKYCRRCEHLPPFGKLPSLTDLLLYNLDSVKRLSAEWHGDQGCSFPALTTLEIQSMPNLEDWSIPCPVESFPRLTKLSILWCPKLLRLPLLAGLSDLTISDSNVALLSSLSILTSLKSLSLGRLEDVFDGDRLLPKDNALEYLRISWCHIMNWANMLNNLSALKSLDLVSFRTLEFFPEGLRCLKSLETIKISFCDNLRTFPATVLEDLPSLRSLTFDDCEKLKPLSGPLKQASNLHDLEFSQLREMQFLPESMQRLSGLKELTIRDCNGLCILPYWFGSLVSLSELYICDCDELESLPDSFTSLKLMRRLTIFRCPKLEKRCMKSEGEDWPKISHVPFIKIGRVVIQDLS